MADADKTLKLLIELGVVGQADAQAAEELLEKQKKTVKELAAEELAASQKTIAQKKQEVAVLEQLKAQRAEYAKAGRDTADFDDAIKRLNHSMEEGGHHLNSGRQKAMLFRQALMSVGAYIPGMESAVYGLGTAMGATFAGVIGGAIAIEAVIKKFKEFDDLLNQQSDWASQPLVDKWGEIRTAIDDTKTSLGEFHAKLEAAGSGADPISTALKLQKELVDEQVKSAQKLLEVNYQIEEEKLRAAAATDPQLKARLPDQLIDLESRKIIAFAGLEQFQNRFAYEQLANEYNAKKLRLPSLIKEADAAKKPSADAEEELKGTQKRMSDYESQYGPHGEATKALTEAQKKLVDAEKTYQDIKEGKGAIGTAANIGGALTRGPALAWQASTVAAAKQAVENLTTQQTVAAKQYADDSKHLEEQKKKATALGIAYDNLAKQAQEYADRLAVLKQELPVAKKNFDLQSATAQAVSNATIIESQLKHQEEAAGRLKNKKPEDVLAGGATAMELLAKLRQGGFTSEKITADYQTAIKDKLTPGAFSQYDREAIARYQALEQAQNQIKLFNDLLQQMGSQSTNILTIVKYHQSGMTTLAKEIVALKNQAEIFESQLRLSRNRPGG